MRFFAKFLVTARPTEQKIEFLMNQMKLTKEQVELCIEVDPSPNQTDFVTWIARMLAKGNLHLPEDGQRIKEQLATFTKLKKAPGFQGNKDINSYTPGTLFTLIEENQGNFSAKEKNREKIKSGAKVVIKDGDILVYKVWEAPALMELSAGTNWCTAHENMATSYLKNGPSFVIFDDGSAYAQFHPSSNQLKDRKDVEIPDSVAQKRRGWGNALRGQGKYRYISDPICVKVIEQLAALGEPGVKEYLAKNVTPDDKLDAAFAEHDDMPDNALKNAIRKNTPLSNDELTKLLNPSRGYYGGGELPSTKAYMRYCMKFFPDQPNPNLEMMLLKEKPSLDYITYVRKFLKRERWPEGEKALLKSCTTSNNSLMLCLEYDKGILKGARWPEFEKKLVNGKGAICAKGLNQYAQHVLQARWDTLPGLQITMNGMVDPEAKMVKGDPAQAIDYAKHFIKGRWPALEQMLKQLGDTGHLLDYQRAVGNGERNSELEPDTLRNASPSQLVDYAHDVIKGRDPEIEKKLLGKDEADDRESWEDDDDVKKKKKTGKPSKEALRYASHVIKGRWPELEQIMLAELLSPNTTQRGYGDEFKPVDKTNTGRDDYWTRQSELPDPWNHYVRYTCKGRWPELEQALLKRYEVLPAEWNRNQSFVQGYLWCLTQIYELVPEVDEAGQPVLDPETGEPEVKNQLTTPQTWPEGQQRLADRSAGYEKILTDKVQESIAEYQAEKADPDEDDGRGGKRKKYQFGVSHMHTAAQELYRYLEALQIFGGSWPEGEKKLEDFDAYRAKATDEEGKSSFYGEPYANKLLQRRRNPVVNGQGFDEDGNQY